MGFIRKQEEKFAVRLLAWRYERLGMPMPGLAALERQAKSIVDEAHRIAGERGRNVASIMKEMVNDLKNKPL